MFTVKKLTPEELGTATAKLVERISSSETYPPYAVHVTGRPTQRQLEALEVTLGIECNFYEALGASRAPQGGYTIYTHADTREVDDLI